MNRAWTETFLAALAQVPNVAAACRAAGISRESAYQLRREDEVFAQSWRDALDTSTDNLVGEMYRRAFEGTEKPVFHMGAQCGHIREYSDTLAIFLAKAHRPEVYGDRLKLQAEVKTPDAQQLRAELSTLIGALCERRRASEDSTDASGGLTGRSGGSSDEWAPDDPAALEAPG